MANIPLPTTTPPSIATDTLLPTTEVITANALPPTTDSRLFIVMASSTITEVITANALPPTTDSRLFIVMASSTISTSSRILTPSRISTSSISTSSALPASTLPAASASVFSMLHPTSPTPLPDGLSTSAKIGIGLGVPLGVIVLAIVAFLGYLYGRRRGNKRNAIPAADEQFHGFPGDKDPSAMQRQGGAGAVGPQQSDANGGLPRYAEELQGSPGVKRHELSAQREATGYFSPDVVTS